ncbi:23S rRNA (uracil(1939)-C(5))-methyltransferase RlmD [Thermosipho atlanticus]|uniref:23S rRNA (Uracil1939-C5)-methyltransferase n=1 Tax=Thermosipho atlanticus DSM 15807 TaxID=1123380 RepID=A0A1M5R5A0_9BACT|nr:23S rRNA (uracil(1939)-C(5))-methyltransferase RlmD [Thermosipho atlanticus]SHH21220.1 23S rRNA (uracil1939-C5)-methyltransferase [Thermosipho atlanticus DSM 15807]
MSEMVYIEKLAYGGSGLGKLPGGKIIFVSGAYPGELVKVDIISDKRDYAIGRLEEVIESIPERRHPVCPYFRKCGGCNFLDLRYSKQLQFKEEIVKEQLSRIARISVDKVTQIQKSNDEYEYRLKMEFAFDYNMKTTLGFKMKNSRKIIDIKKCYIAPKYFNKIVELTPEIIDLHKVPIYKNRKGVLKHLVLRYSPTEKNVMVIFVTKTEKFSNGRQIANQLVKNIPNVSSVVHVMNSNDKIVLRGPYKILRGEGVLSYEFDWEKFQVPPTAFFQNNYHITGKMIEFLTKSLNLNGSETILELYSGLGTFSIRLAALSKHTTAVESNRVAIKAGKANANINNVRNLRFIEADVKEYLNSHEERYDVVVVDPPRSGLEKEVIDKILEISPEKIGYVSCNPATLARDLKKFLDSGKYKIEIIKPFDMFPQTYHIETITILRKRGL